MHGESRTIVAVHWHPAAVAAAFLVIHFAATTLGGALLVQPPSAAAFWPASGTLIAALLLFRRRYWPWLLASGWLAEFIAYTLVQHVFSNRVGSLVGLANAGQSALAAWLIGRFIGDRVDFARSGSMIRLSVLLLAATFVGGLAGAAAIRGKGGFTDFWSNHQMWWLSGFLGAMVLVPLILAWAQSGLRATRDQPPPRHGYVLLRFAVLAIVLWYVFSGRYHVSVLALDPTFLVYAALLWIASHGGARRTTFALLLVSVVSAAYTLAGLGPFAAAHSAPFGPVLNLQAFLVLVAVPLLIVQASIAARKNALNRIRASDERYRAFVQHSSEAIFRFELSQPMPLLLSGTEQRQWLDQHAYIAESNDAFREADGNGAGDQLVARQPVWLKHCLATVPDTIAAGGHVQNVECVLAGPYGLDRTLLVSLTTEVEGGALHRVWGVARDVTPYRAAQRRLEQQQRELRALAAELTLTEERERRRIAADLHDGLAQSLVGLQLHVAAIRSSAEQGLSLPDVSALELTISESTAQVRALMTDLMPPGLYDQGIVAGIRWLADEFAKRQRVQVDFEDDGRAKELAESTAVLVFQAARQLLQNVARHAHATVVTLRTSVIDDRFELVVSDSGVGFNVSDLTFLPTQQGGFGLYSIRERLTIIGGTLEIDSAPGRGTRVRVSAPLAAPAAGRSDDRKPTGVGTAGGFAC